ncbi:MAG: YihY/virulence factor BrkB family protein [Clostridiales bacterium]|nr:YihY/virulence factor BrkB family protein [Clostridiales bacterium]
MNIIRSISKNFERHHIQAYSGQMAFFFTMSIFPFLVVLFTIIGKLSLDSQMLFEFAKIFIPSDITTFLEEYINTITFNSTGLISASLIITLWSSSRAVHAMMRSFNVVFEVDENRNYFYLRVLGFFYTIILIFAIILFLFLPIIGEKILNFLNPVFNIPNNILEIYDIFRWIIIIVAFFFIILAIYMKMPNVKIRFREALSGSLFASLGWILNALIYSITITNFGRMSIVYGGISAILLLSFWLYINSTIIMVGAEIVNYCMNNNNYDKKNPA